MAPAIPNPPQDLADVVGGGWEIGGDHLAQLTGLGALQPDEHVLDVGCGVGRTAIPLTSHISPRGGYEGFDIWPEAIEWCRREITSRYPNFRFTHVDLFNAAYNPLGGLVPAEFAFPYPSEHFDLVFLYSVFTHLLPRDLERYLAEIRRTLKEGGRVLATFFILSEDAVQRLAAAAQAGQTTASDDQAVARYLVDRDFGDFSAGYDVPEWMVAYKEEFLRDLFRRQGFRLQEPFAYGTWLEWATGQAPVQGTQDAIVAYC
jgi:SAM-dependent methyltransferase